MKSIEEIKIELTLKMLSGKISHNDIEYLPKDNKLRTFICSLGAEHSYTYAISVDKKPHNETRTSCCKDPKFAYLYAAYVDRYTYTKPQDETRKSSCKDPKYSYLYAKYVDECSRDDTREAAYKEHKWKQKYIERFGD